MSYFDSDNSSLSSLEDSDDSVPPYGLPSATPSLSSAFPLTSSEAEVQLMHTPRPPSTPRYTRPWRGDYRLRAEEHVPSTAQRVGMTRPRPPPPPPPPPPAMSSSTTTTATTAVAPQTLIHIAQLSASGAASGAGAGGGGGGADGDEANVQNAMLGEEDIMRQILPFILNGSAIMVVDGNMVQRFAPPAPPQRGASVALRANYRAAMRAFLEVLQAHVLGILLNELLRSAEPHYEEAPLIGDELKQLQRRVLVPALCSRFATAGCDPICTVCLESFAEPDDDDDDEDDDDEDDDVAHGTTLSLLGSAPCTGVRTRDHQLVMSAGKGGTLKSTLKPSSRLVRGAHTRTEDDEHAAPVGSDPEALIEAAERGGKRVVCRLPCNHFFCFECAKQWFSQTGSCPNCRAPVRPMEALYAKKPAPLWWLPRHAGVTACEVDEVDSDESLLNNGNSTTTTNNNRTTDASPPMMSSLLMLPQGRSSNGLVALGLDVYDTPLGTTDSDAYNAMYGIMTSAHTTSSHNDGQEQEHIAASPSRPSSGPGSSFSAYASYDWGFALGRVPSTDYVLAPPVTPPHTPPHSRAGALAWTRPAPPSEPLTRAGARPAPTSTTPSRCPPSRTSQLPVIVPRAPRGLAPPSLPTPRQTDTVVLHAHRLSPSTPRPTPSPSPALFPQIQPVHRSSRGQTETPVTPRYGGRAPAALLSTSSSSSSSFASLLARPARHSRGPAVPMALTRVSRPISPPASPSV